MKTIYERIDAGEFYNNIPYPEKGSKPPEIEKKILELKAEIKRLCDQSESERADAMQKYHNGKLEAIKRFRKAVEEACCTANNPKAGALWNKAWEDGHSSGLASVYNSYLELVDLIR